VCVQDSTSGRFQLLSQGTGEILLDACVDYWNGSDLCQLTMSDRYLIIDNFFLVFFYSKFIIDFKLPGKGYWISTTAAA